MNRRSDPPTFRERYEAATGADPGGEFPGVRSEVLPASGPRKIRPAYPDLGPRGRPRELLNEEIEDLFIRKRGKITARDLQLILVPWFLAPAKRRSINRNGVLSIELNDVVVLFNLSAPSLTLEDYGAGRAITFRPVRGGKWQTDGSISISGEGHLPSRPEMIGFHSFFH